MVTERKPKSRHSRKEHDAIWKDAFRLFLPHFLQMFHPQLFAELDSTRETRFLEQELRQIQKRSAVGRRSVDILAEIPLSSGGQMWLLLHIEVQSRKDPELPHRMWVYHYRTYDLHRRPVVSMVLLADNVKQWKPQLYESRYFGCNLSLEYPTFKLQELWPRLEELEGSSNPFALIVASHLKAQQTHPGSRTRLHGKVGLVRRMYQLGMARDEIDGLFFVIDAIMELDPELDREFEQALTQMEESMELETAKRNRFVIRAREEGRDEGRDEARGEVARRMLSLGLDLQLIQQSTGLTKEDIEKLQTAPPEQE